MGPQALRLAKIGYLALGLGLLALLLARMDLAGAWELTRGIGWGFALILGIYMVAFLLDAAAWQATLAHVRWRPRWLYRLWKLRMVGEAVSAVTPLATMGGEPVKALLLKKLYHVGYRDGVGSLVLVKTTILLSLVLFLSVGFVLVMRSAELGPSLKLGAGIGLAALSAGILLFFLVQRGRITTRTVRRLISGRLERRLEHWLQHVQAFDEHLARFYTRSRGRFAASVGLASLNWLAGVAELYAVLWLLGHPVSFTDAWIVETIAELARAAAFFIPARLGAQDGAFVLAVTAITGSPTLGLAVALVRRAREVVWIVWGLGVGWGQLAALRPAAGVTPAAGAGDGPEA